MSFTSGPFASHARAVLCEQDQFEKKNTVLAYNYKVSEFIGFCHSLYPPTSVADSVTTVNEEKLFGYLFYTSRRSVRNRGRQKACSSSTAHHPAGTFIRDEYNCIMDASYTTPNDLVGYDVLNQTYSGILKLWKRQCDLGANNATKDQLRSQRVLSLMDLVKKRKKRYVIQRELHYLMHAYHSNGIFYCLLNRLARRGFQEKLKSGLSPYLLVEKIPTIEKWLWEHNSESTIFSLSSIRDRFVFLLSTHAILRGESVFLSDLSDYCDLVVDQAGCSECQILVLQVDTGKTNGLKTLYGRVMRHKNVDLCPIGAFAFMLLGRFEHTNEVDTTYNFLDNKSWFGVKALIDYRKNDLYVSVKDQSYAKTIKACCKDIQINSQHFVHIGRSIGPIIAEIAEMEGDAIANLGNWNISVREDRYSAKLPMKIMRVMAGHSDAKNIFYLPRSDIKPSDRFLRQIFPFIESQELKIASSTTSHPTASAFLGLLRRLRKVVLQDAAVLLYNGRTHSLFHHPVFLSQEFKDFQQQVVASVLVATVNDPATASVRSVLPGVCERLDNLQNCSHQDAAQICTHIQQADEYVRAQTTTKHDLQSFAVHIGKFTFPSTSNAHSDFSLVPERNCIGAKNISPDSSCVAPILEYKLQHHMSVTSMWDEWFDGINDWERVNKKWRAHFTPADAKKFSRMKKIVDSIIKAVKLSGTSDVRHFLTEYDKLFRKCNYSLYNMEKALMSQIPTTPMNPSAHAN